VAAQDDVDFTGLVTDLVMPYSPHQLLQRHKAALYPFPLIVLSANRMKLGPGGGSRVQEMSRTAFVGDQLTHGGQKGFGMTKHGRSGHATRSPRFRFLQKLEAQKNDRKDRSRIKDPKQSVEELFHPRKPTRT
jgi:hypothetical protein